MFRQECKIKILCPEQGFPAFEPAFLAAFPNSVIKARAAARVPRSHSAPHIRTPPRGRRVPRLCVALCSCVGARKMSANARASSAFAAAFLAALITSVRARRIPAHRCRWTERALSGAGGRSMIPSVPCPVRSESWSRGRSC